MADTSNEFEDAAASVMQSQVATVRNNVYYSRASRVIRGYDR